MLKWIILLTVSLALFVYLTAFVLPRRFLRPKYSLGKSYDRGVYIVEEKNGRSILYRPQVLYRKYLKQYVLSDRDKDKLILMDIAEFVKYIDLDVVVFNDKNEVVKTINLKSVVTGEPIESVLPDETAYVSIYLNRVNDHSFSNEFICKPSGAGVAAEIILTTLLIFAETFLAKWCISYFFGGVYREIFMVSSKSITVSIIIAATAAILNAVTVITAIAVNIKKQRKGLN